MGIKSLGNKKSIKYAAVWDETGTGAMKPKPFNGPVAMSFQGDRGILWNGYFSGANQDRIEYISISTPGNSQDFGDAMESSRARGAASNGTKSICGGGGSGPNRNNIDKLTIASTGNSTDFGDLTVAGQCNCVFIATYAVWDGRGQYNTIDYVSIATDGDAADFGDMMSVNNDGPAPTGDTTRGCFMGGHGDGTSQTRIEYITFATPGNATYFGDMYDSGYAMTSGLCANGIRGLTAGGEQRNTSSIEYITPATLGNGQSFGDLSQGRRGMANTSNDDDRGVFAGGYSPDTNVIDYVTMSTDGNATDFGDMITSCWGYSGCSGD